MKFFLLKSKVCDEEQSLDVTEESFPPKEAMIFVFPSKIIIETMATRPYVAQHLFKRSQTKKILQPGDADE